MSVGKRDGTHDLLLASDATASPTTSVSLMLAEDSDGIGQWTESRRQAFVQRQGTGPVNFADKDPLSDLVFSQKDWSGGTFQALYEDEASNKVAKSDGLDMRGKNVATLGMKLNGPMDVYLRNGSAEDGTTNGWAGDDSYVISNETTASADAAGGPGTLVHGGSRMFWIRRASGDSGNVKCFKQTIANHENYRNYQVTFSGYINNNNATGGGPRIFIADGNSTTYTSDMSASTSWQRFSHTHNMHSGASTLEVGFDTDSSGLAGGIFLYADDMHVTVGTNADPSLLDAYGFGGAAVDGGDLYAAIGSTVCKWNEANDVWENVASAAPSVQFSSLVQFDGNLYASENSGGAYRYGSGTSWTTATGSAPLQDADFFVTTGDSGNTSEAIWKGIKASNDATNCGVYKAAVPINSGQDWGSVFKVGTKDTDITGLFHGSNTLLVGKEEGLFEFKRFFNDGSAANDFVNKTLEYKENPSSTNFDKGVESKGKFFTTANQQTFFEYDNGQLTDASSIFQAPRAAIDSGGTVRAMASGPNGLWILLDTPTADATEAKTCWLLNLEIINDKYVLHTIEKVTIGDVGGLVVHGNYLWAFGKTYLEDGSRYAPSVWRWDLPEKTKHPAFDATPSINTTGNFDTPRWDGNLPDADKAFISCTLFHKANLDAEHTIVVKYGVNNAASTTRTLGTANTGSTTQTTFYFNSVSTPESNAIGKDIQLNITLNTDDTVSPELYGYALHSMLSPARVRMMEVFVVVGDNVQLHTGAWDTATKAEIKAALETLESQVYPIYVSEDLDEDGLVTSGRWKIIPDSLAKQPYTDSGGNEIWKFQMQEVTVS